MKCDDENDASRQVVDDTKDGPTQKHLKKEMECEWPKTEVVGDEY